MKRDLKFKEKNLQESNLINLDQHLKSIGGFQMPSHHSKKSKSKTNDEGSTKQLKQIERQIKKRNSASFSKASDGGGPMNRSQGSDKVS